MLYDVIILHKRKISASIILIVVVFSFFQSTIFNSKVNALSGSEFQAGKIIDDFVFYNNQSMSLQQIQNFLNAKVPECDTYGTKPSSRSGYPTRADWGRANGYAPPYTCIRNYSQTTVSKPAEPGLCDGYSSAMQTAAQIIHGVSQSCGINPKVLIVLLQKEQSLVTDDWPWSVQYRSATGYGCPDTAPCDAQYYGFFNQVYAAARQFKYYAKYPNSFNYRAGRNNYILYNPNSSCGGSNVYIQNQATAGLYIYTPYQPNQSALNNLYGSGDVCGAYGNRNFWRMYNDWFGPTYANCDLLTMNGTVFRLYNPVSGDYLYTTNNIEVCLAQTLYGYIKDDFVFKTTPTSGGGIPVYRLSSPGGKHFYTTNNSEKNSLVSSSGYIFEGIAFSAKSTTAAGYSPIYRLSPKKNTSHYYTPSSAEITSLSNEFTNEGVIFYVPTTSNTVSIYRLLSPDGSHFYTSSVAEKDYALTNLGYRSEGIAFAAKTTYTNETVPVYRLMSLPYHKFTPSKTERIAMLNRGYSNESIAFYSPTAGIKPIYRLYRHSDGDHLLTTSIYERDQALNKAGYSYEGVTFYSY